MSLRLLRNMGFLALTLLFIVSCGSQESDIHSGQAEAGIINPESFDKDDPITASTARISLESQDGESYCTGVLIAPNLLVTAAHCFDHRDGNCNQPTKSRITDIKFFARSSGSASARQFVLHPNREGFAQSACEASKAAAERKKASKKKGKTPSIPSAPKNLVDNYDIAVILLSEEPKGVSPTKIVSASEADPANGDLLTIAGVGQSSVSKRKPEKYKLGDNGEGSLRKGTVAFFGRSGPKRTGISLKTIKARACHGDSGGPVFVTKDQKLSLLAVLRSVDSDTCSGFTYATVVSSHQAWIDQMIQWAQLADQPPKK